MTSSFMTTASGRQVSLPNPMPHEIFLDDIATHLSRQVRYAGASMRPMTVAQHSIACAHLSVAIGCDLGMSSLTPKELVREALMHDAAEYITCDIPSPIKLQFRREWRRMQAPIESAIRKRFNLRATEPHCVDLADKALLILESQEIMVSPIDSSLIPQAAYESLASLAQLEDPPSEGYEVACWTVRQNWSEAECYGAFLDLWKQAQEDES